MKKFKHVIINDIELKTIVDIGLKYNPDPWFTLGSTLDEIYQAVRNELVKIIQTSRREALFESYGYHFPSTLVIFTKVFDHTTKQYSEDVVRVNLHYSPPIIGFIDSIIYPSTSDYIVHPNGNFNSL
jgi:hypothetical protein